MLLARLGPVASVGMRCMLSEYGVDVVGEEDRPLAIEATPASSRACVCLGRSEALRIAARLTVA